MTIPLAVEISTSPDCFNLYIAFEKEIHVYDYLSQQFRFKIEGTTKERMLLFNNDAYLVAQDNDLVQIYHGEPHENQLVHKMVIYHSLNIFSGVRGEDRVYLYAA